MKIEWDPDKATSNLIKHGIDFADAVIVLSDDFAITIPDEHKDEERFVTLGVDALSRLLVVVYCWRDDRMRIISARKATRPEHKQYEAIR